jgi:outer membrane beta-barrel protein
LGAAPAVAFAQGEEGGDAPVDAETTTEAAETEAAADDDSGKRKLSDRVRSVQRKDFLKKERIEVFPQFALDLNDPFFQHLVVGVGVSYHLADSLAFELRGGGVVASIEQAAIRFVRRETESLIEDPPEFKYHVDLDALWAPFYGKISLFGESILHFDTYVTVGAGAFGTDAALNPAANIGIGQRYFITDWLVARVEIRDYIFMDNRGGESDLQNLLILGFAVSGFFPMTFEYEFQ